MLYTGHIYIQPQYRKPLLLGLQLNQLPHSPVGGTDIIV